MSKDKNDIIIEEEFSQIISEKYLAYALSTITSRSLPDVRDGLKPVHRRILWAMHLLKLDPKSGFKKCARVVGDVIGKYHPHGDTAVYDAMVRLAQNFSVRYPLVEGQGNFGSIDGDNAAAMRYTEARMTEVATLMLRDIANDTVDFRPTYDSLDEEPTLLPAYFPNLLANGSEGIAVGMATAIPPHNAEELCDAAIHLIKYPEASNATLVTKYVQAPDFPTAGEIIEPQENIIKSYETGKGAFRLRAKWEVEELDRGLYQVIVTEIPYQVQKSRLLEKLASNIDQKKTPLLGNIRDESAEEIRIVFEPKNRNVDAETLMESLFRSSDLEIRYSMNLNVLDSKGLPRVMSLREALLEFLAHQKEVLIRKSNCRLRKIEHRLEVLGGLLIAYLNIDEVIRIIRQEDEPKEFMKQKFSLTDIQVEAILNMKLRSLRKLEEIEIRKENDALVAERDELKELLASDDLQKKRISDNIREVKKLFSKKTELGARRTKVTHKSISSNVISIEAFVEKEPITVACSKLGWIRGFKGHAIEPETIKYKEGDSQQFIFKAQTTDKILILTSIGRFYTLPADKIPGGKGFGDPIRLLSDISGEEKIVSMFVYQENIKMLLASSIGKGFIVNSNDIVAQTKGGKQVLNVKDGIETVICTPVNSDRLAVVGENRRMIIFETSEIPEMKRGQGVQLQKYKDGGISDAKFFNSSEGLSYRRGNGETILEDYLAWEGKRAGRGKTVPQGFSKNNKF